MARLIDADALMDFIKGYRLGKIPKGELEWKIENAPTVDAVPVVHGRWECQDGYFSDNWKCSACGIVWFFEYDPTETETKVNYCPNCGARMDGDEQ
jgi:DNA-directed RNA polymerase subunit RPC12/RpoP